MKGMVILGWGSLIWEERPDFNLHISQWLVGGPRLPIEFARKSKSRHGALTLVIDREIGTPVETLYTISKRTDPLDAICDLRSREGTTVKNIGYVNLETGDEQARDELVRSDIKIWANRKGIPFVAWTDLEANLKETTPEGLARSALSYLQSLDAGSLGEAVKYIMMAPPQVNTRLRESLMGNRWFREQVRIYKQTKSHDQAGD